MDLNPFAVLLNKVELEYIPKFGKRIADEVRRWGHWINRKAQKDLDQYYPCSSDGDTPISYLWARTITCEGPGCGAEVPMMRTLWLAKKGNNSIALRLCPNYHNKSVDFKIIFNARTSDVVKETVARSSATCPICGYTTPVAKIRNQMKIRKDGAADARLIVIRQDDPKTGKRTYRLLTQEDIRAIQAAKNELERRKKEFTDQYSMVPNEPTPMGGGRGDGRAFS
ncbi:hypothetical protein ES703_34051 [subsurface metagenome]